MIPENIIFVGVALNLFGQVWYIKSIIKGHAKPNLASWVPWMLAPFVGVFFQLKAGAGLSVLPVFMAGFGPLIIIIAALLSKNALWKISTFDIYCGILALLALVIYAFTNDLGVSILFAILSDILASIPTLIKSWKFPETESSSAYLGAVISNTLGLLTIKVWSFPIYSFGIWLVALNLTMVLIIFRKKIFPHIVAFFRVLLEGFP